MIKILDSKNKNFDKTLDMHYCLNEKIKFNLIQFQLLKLLKMLRKMEIKPS